MTANNASPKEPAESSSLAAFVKQHADLIVRLHARAEAARWALPPERFAAALHRSAEKNFRGKTSDEADLESYLQSLQLQDLALAAACAAGNEPAWDFFVARYRPELRSAARAILHAAGSAGDARADELADGIYAELWGVRSARKEVRERSLFEYFHGRSKLTTWLRTVLAQRHVDALRASQRTVSLDAQPDGAPRPEPSLAPAAPAAPPDPQRQRYLAQLDAALAEALGELVARDRLLLAFFYQDGLTLAAIGRTTGEHESTVSRRLERIRGGLRERVTAGLGKSLAPAQIELAFEYALDDWPFDLGRALDKGASDATPASNVKRASLESSG